MKMPKFLQVASIVCACCTLPVIATGQDIPAPKGWSESARGGSRILSNGATTIEVGPLQRLNGKSMKDWISGFRKMGPKGMTLISAQKAQADRVPGSYVLLRNVKFAGAKGYSILYACPGPGGTARLLRMDVHASRTDHMRTGVSFGEAVCKADGQQVASVDTKKTTSSPTGTSAKVKTGALPPVKKVDGLVEVRGMITYGIQAGGMFGTTEDFIALFDDGTYTNDLGMTFGRSKEASKAERPKRWGTWRKRGGSIELKGSGENEFSSTLGDWRVEPGSKDHKMSGCYGRMTSSSMDGYGMSSTVGLARTYCFYPDGRFTNSSTAYGNSSGPSVTMSVSGEKRGRYRIDGNMIRFVYDNGHDFSAVFGYLTEEKHHVLLNGARFRGGKKR